ncbi:MAG: LuxR C-terminal-related transcriptional regulator [Aquincola tertiaricarbonis]
MDDSVLLSPRSAECLVRAIESAPQVRRRHQFFVWLQSQLHSLLPHSVAVCGAYQRSRRELVFEVFQSTMLPADLLASLADARSPLMTGLLGHWLAARGRAVLVASDTAEAVLGPAILVHGVSRPQRPAELESFFVFAEPERPLSREHLLHLELLLPHLHATYLRVQATELELNNLPPPLAPRLAGAASPVTERERQILGWVREGKSNQQIGELLGISPLTVKNHIQKILRKLGATNRAQAVALAMTRQVLLNTGPPPLE